MPGKGGQHLFTRPGMEHVGCLNRHHGSPTHLIPWFGENEVREIERDGRSNVLIDLALERGRDSGWFSLCLCNPSSLVQTVWPRVCATFDVALRRSRHVPTHRVRGDLSAFFCLLQRPFEHLKHSHSLFPVFCRDPLHSMVSVFFFFFFVSADKKH